MTITKDYLKVDNNIWIFQGNPNKYRIVDALSDSILNGWRVTRFASDIKLGDKALIWICGKSAGIYAIADINSSPAYMPLLPKEEKYFIDKTIAKREKAVELKFTHYFLSNPIYRCELKDIPGLKNLSIIKCAMGTNFPVKKQEWEIIRRKIEEHTVNK